MSMTLASRKGLTRKQRRLGLVLAGLAILAAALALIMGALRDQIVLFYSPTEIAEQTVTPTETFRIGGMVAEGTVVRGAGETVTFEVTDFNRSLKVAYLGILPDLFREGQGIVAQGKLGPDGVFIANQVLAKHDESYMPPEAAEALERAKAHKESAAEAYGGSLQTGGVK